MTESKSVDIEIAKNIRRIRFEIAEACAAVGRAEDSVRLMAVTKTVDPQRVNAAISCGVSLLGENRAQELLQKQKEYLLKRDSVHFIGHLQTNKVRQIVDKVSMIQSVGSFHLAQEIDRQAQRQNIVMPVLVEVNIGGEGTKSGVLPEHAKELLLQMSELEYINVQGMMVIPPPGNSGYYFAKTQNFYVDIQSKKLDNIDVRILSMGMSQDYAMAVRYGSTLVRLGTAIFGKRL